MAPRCRVFRLSSLLIGLFAIACITLTYREFTQTFDEPATIAAGIELLDSG